MYSIRFTDSSSEMADDFVMLPESLRERRATEGSTSMVLPAQDPSSKLNSAACQTFSISLPRIAIVHASTLTNSADGEGFQTSWVIISEVWKVIAYKKRMVLREDLIFKFLRAFLF